MMYSNGGDSGNSGYSDGDGYGCEYGFKGDSYGKGCKGDGYGVGIDGYDDGSGNGDGYGYGRGCKGDGRGGDFREDEEEEQLSAIRLLADDHPDINFYLAQLHLMVQRTTTLKEETK